MDPLGTFHLICDEQILSGDIWKHLGMDVECYEGYALTVFLAQMGIGCFSVRSNT